MNLQALSMRFCTTSTSRTRSPYTTGSAGAISTCTPRASMRPCTSRMASCTIASNGTASGGFIMRPMRDSSSSSSSKRRILSVASTMRAMSACIRSQFPSRASLLHKAQETANGNQRRFQIVRDRVGKPLQFGVARFQLMNERLALGLGLFAFRNVLHSAINTDQAILGFVPDGMRVRSAPSAPRRF